MVNLLAERKPQIGKCALDVLKAFLAQTFDGKEVVLALSHETTDGANGCVVECRLHALRKIELGGADLEYFGIHHERLGFSFAPLGRFNGKLSQLRDVLFLEADDRFELLYHR